MTTLAAIDRVVHHSVILDMMSVESYRAEVAGQHHLSEEAGSNLYCMQDEKGHRISSRASWNASWIGKETIMKFLLTSSGISNDSIRNALVDLLGKPIAESSSFVIPTAWYAYPGGLAGVYRLIHGVAKSPFCELGWKSLGVLELTALPSIKKENWVPLVQEVDALLVGGGEIFYLCYWMWQSGLADLCTRLSRAQSTTGVPNA
jgi:hypothetical protein